MMVCKGCGDSKSEDDFYLTKPGGPRTGKCKVCICAQVKLRRKLDPYVRQYDRERAVEPHRRAANRATVIKWREEHPEAYAAQTAVGNAIRDGKLAKGEVCEVDGCDRTDVHGHHEDYSKPLEVRWFCALHHHRHHHQEAA